MTLSSLMAISSPEIMLVPKTVSKGEIKMRGTLHTKIDITKASTSNLAADAVLITDTQILLRLESVYLWSTREDKP